MDIRGREIMAKNCDNCASLMSYNYLYNKKLDYLHIDIIIMKYWQSITVRIRTPDIIVVL